MSHVHVNVCYTTKKEREGGGGGGGRRKKQDLAPNIVLMHAFVCTHELNV